MSTSKNTKIAIVVLIKAIHTLLTLLFTPPPLALCWGEQAGSEGQPLPVAPRVLGVKGFA